MIIDGKKIASEIMEDVRRRVADLPYTPILCDVVVGNDPVSLSYVRIKQKKAEAVGMEFLLEQLPDNATVELVKSKIAGVQKHKRMRGLIVQLPLPARLDSSAVLDAINLVNDVDVISPDGSDLFYDNNLSYIPPTAGAILHIIDSLSISPGQARIAVIGQGELVGRPTTHLLRGRGFQVVVADKQTKDLSKVLVDADIIITGVGKPNLITADMVGGNSIIIDAGTSESGGSITGDADFESLHAKVRAITPVPGGVGPVTVAKLLENVVISAESRAI